MRHFIKIFICLSISYTQFAWAENKQQAEVVFTLLENAADKSSFKANLTVTNLSSVDLEDWRLHLNFMRPIKTVSDAAIETMIGDYYVIKPEKSQLNKNETVTFELLGAWRIRNDSDAPSAYFITASNVASPITPLPRAVIFPHWQPSASEDVYTINNQNVSTGIEGNPVDPAEMGLTLENTLIIPNPVKLSMSPDKSAEFLLHKNTQIIVKDKQAEQSAQDIANWLRMLPETNISSRVIELQTSDKKLPPEGYILNVSDKKIQMKANDAAGFYYAFKTLQQLAHIFKMEDNISIPPLTIEDWPRFSYRGVHLDVARHFFTIEEIKQLLEQMAQLKLNYFHWHLTDDEGWRLQIKAYPELTQIGGKRGYQQKIPPHYTPGSKIYQGFYTQGQVKEIIAYAAQRHITIIPEIDVPGHARAMIQSLPDLLIDKADKSSYLSIQRFSDNVLSACLDKTYAVLDNIFAEVSDLFPGEYIHIGGDEVPKGAWANDPLISPNCYAIYQENNFTTQSDMQQYFNQKVSDILKKYGKKMAGWGEVIGDFDSEKPMIYAWHNIDNANQAAQAGYPVVLTMAKNLYFDLSYSADPREPGQYWAGFVNNFTPYATNPSEIDVKAQYNIRGVQGALWSEKMTNAETLNYFAFPRLLSLSELAWSASDRRNWLNFRERVSLYLPILDSQQIPYRLSIPGVNQQAFAQGVLEINTEFPNTMVRCESSVKEPDIHSPLYKEPIPIDAKMISCRTFDSKGRAGRTVTYQR
jgi:hexosaminidase